MFRCSPSSDVLEKLDPLEKLFMQCGWMDDQAEKAELMKNTADILGSFWNPEAVKAIIGDGDNVHKSSDADFEKSMEMVRATGGEGKRRRRRVIDG
jgi:hypothetical protein